MKVYNIQLLQSMKNDELVPIQKFALQNLKVKINDKNPYHQLTFQAKDVIAQEEASGLKPNVGQVSIRFTISEPLNYCLKKRADIFTIWINSYMAKLSLSTREGEYCFQQMNYYVFAETQTNKFYDKADISILQADSSFKKIDIILKIFLTRQGKTIQEIINLKEITVQLGNRDFSKTIRAQISQINVCTYFSNKQIICASPISNKLAFTDRQYSYPLGIFNNLGHIYQSLNLTQTTVEQMQKLIKSLPIYGCKPNAKQNKLYICHDMKGGYKEDINFQNNMDENNKKLNTAYRYQYLEQSQIFNYFSHYNITIPPKHWRILCKRFNTKCLGTFILEQAGFQQDVLVSKQFALFLVAVAKKCKFDGYLINIQVKINRIAEFKKWLQFLTLKIHQFIPNSQIIWYDSISCKTGAIAYQNSLSAQNYEFYRMTDGLFTNYWWNQNLLKQTVQLKGNQPQKIYIGNDCFGRNTYGGGKLDIYKAVNKLMEFKNQLSVALFAPGFTYEQGGEHSRHIYKLNELAMYKGLKSQLIVLDKWQKVINKGNGWKTEGEWSVTSYDVCQRSVLFKFPPMTPNSKLKIQFIYQIMSTPPLTDSPYKIVLQLLDDAGNVLDQSQAYNFNNYKKAPEVEQQRIEQLQVDSQTTGKSNVTVKIIQMGKSSKQWAGHFGPRFKNQKVCVLIYDKQKHWINKYPVNHPVIGQLYHSYCNMGYGDSFYCLGLKLQNKYSYLADFDLPHTHTINHPLQNQVVFDEAFVGGSSLLMRGQTSKLLKLLIPKGLNLKQDFFIQITTKKAQNIELNFKYMSKLQQERIFAAKLISSEQVNEWKRFTFKLTTSVGQVKDDIRTIVDIHSTTYPYYIGQIKIAKQKKQNPQDINCSIQLSRDFTASNNFYINVNIKSKFYNRLLITNDKYAAFIHIHEGFGYLRNIPIQKNQQFEIKIIDIDSYLQTTVLRDVCVSSASLSQLIFKGTITI